MRPKKRHKNSQVVYNPLYTQFRACCANYLAALFPNALIKYEWCNAARRQGGAKIVDLCSGSSFQSIAAPSLLLLLLFSAPSVLRVRRAALPNNWSQWKAKWWFHDHCSFRHLSTDVQTSNNIWHRPPRQIYKSKLHYLFNKDLKCHLVKIILLFCASEARIRFSNWKRYQVKLCLFLLLFLSARSKECTSF